MNPPPPSPPDPPPASGVRGSARYLYHWFIRSLASGFLLLAFLIDLLTPMGISTGFIYVGIVVFAAYETGPRGGLITAALASLLSVLGLYWSAGDPLVPHWLGTINRAISLGVTWLVATLIYLHLRALEQAEGIRIRLHKEQNERRQREMDLAYVATHDSLTGLPNRALLLDRLSHALLKLGRDPQGRLLAVYVDMDRFREINVGMGIEVGDEVLRLLAERLRKIVRPGDTVARLVGDEYFILVEQMQARESIEPFLSRLWSGLYAPFEVGGQTLHPAFSLGVALVGPQYSKADQVLRDAYVAMRRAKSRGGDAAVSFSDEMRSGAFRHAQLEHDLRRAVRGNQFTWVYQPIVELATGRVVGAEALVRWNHPQHGTVPPGEFIPLAERTGIVTAIDWLGLQEVCVRLNALREQRQGRCGFVTHCNLSPRHFSSATFSRDITQLLEKHNIPSGCLLLEITEEALGEDPDAVQAVMQQLQELGVHFSVDDFGTRYSSLSYLYRFPFRLLKVDKSFTCLMLSSPKHRAIVEAIITLAQILNLTVIVEGIEQVEEALAVQEMGAAYGQGYLFAKPMPWAELMTYWETNRSNGQKDTPA